MWRMQQAMAVELLGLYHAVSLVIWAIYGQFVLRMLYAICHHLPHLHTFAKSHDLWHGFFCGLLPHFVQSCPVYYVNAVESGKPEVLFCEYSLRFFENSHDIQYLCIECSIRRIFHCPCENGRKFMKILRFVCDPAIDFVRGMIPHHQALVLTPFNERPKRHSHPWPNIATVTQVERKL